MYCELNSVLYTFYKLRLSNNSQMCNRMYNHFHCFYHLSKVIQLSVLTTGLVNKLNSYERQVLLFQKM